MSNNRRHQSTIWDEIQQKDSHGNYKKFSFTYAKKDGALAKYNDALFSSIHIKGSTINLFIDNETKPKTFRRILFTEYNGIKLYI